MNTPIRVLVVDDHALVRCAIAEQLQHESDLTVVACARNGEEAILLAREHAPDVVVLDIDMPGMVGFDAARMIKEERPATQIVFLTAFLHDRYIEQALQVKAMGYVTKREAISTLVHAIREVAAGGAYFSPDVQARMVIDGDNVTLPDHSRSRLSTLTSREIEILRYIAQGLPKKDIAGALQLSPKTVDRHTENLMHKLDLHDRVELTRFAIREGLTEA